MSNRPLEKILSDELKSGLKITLVDEAGELYARVSWIHWDSGFRDSGLAVEDRIVALNDVPLALPEDPRARRIARDRIETHLKAVESIAKEFEEKWNGGFKGALAPRTIDELVDSTSWRVNAETLVSIRTPAVVTEVLNTMDGYYEESFERPLKSLIDKADDLEGAPREEALRAIELARKRVEESVRERISRSGTRSLPRCASSRTR